MSRRFLWDGFTSQAMQRGIFQWRPDVQQAWFINVFDIMHDKGLDPWLQAFRSVPPPLDSSFDAGKSWDEIIASRLALLDSNPAIKAKYLELGLATAMNIYGLPTSKVTDMGNHFVVRFQRAAIQQWKEDVPWAKAGQVTVANGGEVAVEANLFDKNIVTPEQPPVPEGPDRPLPQCHNPLPQAPSSTGSRPTYGRRIATAPYRWLDKQV